MILLFTSKNQQAIYEYLMANKKDNRIIISYRTLAAEVGCTAGTAHKNIVKLQNEGYLEVISTGKGRSGSGTLIELKEAIAI